jgi:hypothetical protein
MFRFLFRLIGFVLLAAGFVALVIDGTKSIAAGRVIVTVLGETWRNLHFTSLQTAQPAIEHHLASWLWDPVMMSVLLSPTAAVGLIVGAMLMWLGRKPAPRIGVIGRR